jgi:mono/diheme cytochrome c family protein
MSKKNKPNILPPKRVLFGLLLSIFFAGLAFAHGQEKHPGKSAMDQHMQAMMAVKEKIPEEYRIMERTPIRPDETSIERGKDLFAQYCAVCHGKQGDGKGPAAASLQTPPANFLDTRHSGIYNPGEKYWIIGNGSGETGMPGFSQISPIDRWHLVNYILFLQKHSKTVHPHDPDRKAY